MLQIRLKKPSSDSAAVPSPVKLSPAESVTVVCPDHLVLADLPVAKGVGAATIATVVKSVGRRSRRSLGERVHFCVRCDFPIAIYGRISPCEHAFCLDCSRSDSTCYLCDERIQKIQTIKMMEGIFICAAPHCLKSFLKRTDFESHIYNIHSDLLQPNAHKDDGIESEVQSTKQPTTSDSAVRGSLRPIVHSGSSSQLHDFEDKARRQQLRESSLPRPMMQSKQPFFGQAANYPSEMPPDHIRPPGFDRPGLQNHFQQNMQGTAHPDSGQFSDKQLGVQSEALVPEFPPMHGMQAPNFMVTMNANPMFNPQFGIPPFQPDGSQQFYGGPYDMSQMARADLPPEIRGEQGSALGYPPAPAGAVNFMPNYSQQWNTGSVPGGQVNPDGFANMSDSQGNVAFYQGDYGRNPGMPTMIPPPPPSADKGVEAGHGSNSMDSRDGKGILAPQPFGHPPPPPPPMPCSSQHKRGGNYYSDDMGHDGQGGFGWQNENRDGFGSGQD